MFEILTDFLVSESLEEPLTENYLEELYGFDENTAAGLTTYESPFGTIHSYQTKLVSTKSIVKEPDGNIKETNSGKLEVQGTNVSEQELEIRSKSKYRSLVIMNSKKLVWFKPSRTITVNYPDQPNYTYKLRRPMGQWPEYPEFQPDLTPEQILCAGIFEGWKYRDCYIEFPREWYLKALDLNKIAILRPMRKYNKYNAYPLEYVLEWREEKEPEEPEDESLLHQHDPRGWLQWYFRFYLGRRIPRVDKVRIRRWVFFKKKFMPLLRGCRKGDLNCKPRLKQAILCWAIDPEKYGK